MPSKMITRRQKSARNVCAAIVSHSQEAQEAIAGILEPHLGEGDSVPNLVPLQLLFEKILEQHRQEIVVADEAHLAELRNDTVPRDRRDAAVAALAERLIDLRDVMAGVLGASAADSFLGIGGAMVRDPDVLARKARRVVTILQSDTPSMPPPRVAGVVVDPTAWAEDLEGPVKELEDALYVVARDRRRAESTLMAKRRALRDYDEAFQRIAQLQESIFRFANLKDLADRVRPSGRRPGQTLISTRSEEEEAPSEASQPIDPLEEAADAV